MEVKKNSDVDIESRKGMFFLVGLLIAVAIVLQAFEWKVYEISATTSNTTGEQFEEEELIPVTRQELKPPPPPPPKPTEIEIVEDEEEIEDEVEIEFQDEEEEIEQDFSEEEEVAEEPQIFTIVEEMPSFPGGEEQLFKYLGDHIKYPQMAKEANISGIVYVTFVVMEDGSIKSVKLLRGIGGGCDQEALKVVKNMPKWKSGKQRGKAVRVQFNLPIRFTLM